MKLMLASYNLKLLLISFILIFHYQSLKAQEPDTIKGVIRNTLHEKLPFATVTLVNDSATVLSYAISDRNGEYRLLTPLGFENSKLWIEANIIGYLNKKISFSMKIHNYDFDLSRDDTALEDVMVKSQIPIKKIGDTLRYAVESFADIHDRSIGDVLRRMPGISIADDGTIYHNGKKIQNLYIQGDDLMSGRYGLATKAIRKEMIESVDIINNFQPIKVLKDKITSNATALNLILKDVNNLKIATNAELGLGLPKLYNLSITPIILNNKIKSISTFGLNNNGVDYSDFGKKLGTSNLINDISNKAPSIDLSLGTVSNPDLPLSTYYLNQSQTANVNLLFNSKSGIQYKTNLQLFHDKNHLNYLGNSNVYLMDDTISYIEQQSVTNIPLLINGDFNIQLNKKSFFLNNTTSFSLNKETNTGFMLSNEENFDQSH